MNRRSVIAAGTTGLLGVGGLGLVYALRPASSDDESFDYRGRAPIVYERSDLSLDLLHDPVSHGHVAEFELTNVGDTRIIPGCGIAWALQSHRDGQWMHVTWTPKRLINLCATLLDPGDTRKITLPMEASELERMTDVGEVAVVPEPGIYRLLLVGVDPYLAIEFEVIA
jgi:hypothetical protein